jgi:hypothetical protein
VDVGVCEARQDAPPAQVDHVGRGERRLVRPDASGDAVAGDRERGRDRQAGVERADGSVLEDHGARL